MNVQFFGAMENVLNHSLKTTHSHELKTFLVENEKEPNKKYNLIISYQNGRLSIWSLGL